MPQYFTEIGKTGIKWSAGYVYEEFLPVLQGSRGIKIYREMRDNDPIVGACLFAVKQVLRESRWDVKPFDPEDADCKKDAEFLRECMTSMSHPWSDFVSNILSMLDYGWSWFEQVFKRQKDGKIVWKKIAHRSQSSLEKWELDENGGIRGMWQRPAPDYRAIYLPIEKSLLFRSEPAGDNPEGRSILRNAYRPWYYKKAIEEIEGIGVERDLAGLPILVPPENLDIQSDAPEVKDAIVWGKKLITNIRRDEQDGVFLPYGWKLELLSSPGKRQFDTTAIIDRYNREIAATVLAQFIMLGMQRTGSYALAKEQTNLFFLCLEGWADSIATTFNRYAVPTLFRLNGIHRPPPYVVHTNLQRYNLKDLANYVSTLADKVGLVIDEDVHNYLKRYARLSEFSDIRK